MSSTSNPPAAAAAAATETTTTAEKKEKDAEFFGINFNNPLALGGLLFIGIPAGYFFINLLKGFLFKEPEQIPPAVVNRRIPRPSAEELRKAEYQRNLDLQNQRQQLSREQEYYENLKRYGVVEQNNNNLKQYNIHKNFEQQEPYIENENMIDVIDDNMIDYNNYVFNKDIQRQPFVVERPQPQRQSRRQQDLPPQQQEDSLLISSEEIDTYTDTEDIDTSRIPPEFVSVGNRPAAFENIQPVDNKQPIEKDDDIYNLDNYEISEKELKEMEANAMNSEYYK